MFSIQWSSSEKNDIMFLRKPTLQWSLTCQVINQRGVLWLGFRGCCWLLNGWEVQSQQRLGSNPHPLHWKCDVLTTGPLHKSQFQDNLSQKNWLFSLCQEHKHNSYNYSIFGYLDGYCFIEFLKNFKNRVRETFWGKTWRVLKMFLGLSFFLNCQWFWKYHVKHFTCRKCIFIYG